MPGNADIRSLLDAWRGQGADRADPLRFGVIAALAQRADRHDGAVRKLLQDRLKVLVDSYTSAIAGMDAVSKAAEMPSADEARLPASGPLKDLLDHLGASQGPPGLRPDADSVATASPPTPAPLPVLDEFQQLWSRIRTDSQLRQSLDSAPEDAGPLHSSSLLHRAMTLMHEAAPGYLQHFIAYADALSWMEQLQEDGVLDTHTTSRSTDATPAGKPHTRKRAKPQRA
jgi:hypothetical protein